MYLTILFHSVFLELPARLFTDIVLVLAALVVIAAVLGIISYFRGGGDNK